MENLEKILSREHWITQQGEKKYPHEFTDEHLINTIQYLHRAVRRYRLEEARILCEQINRIGHNSTDIERYYSVFKKQMDDCLGELDDTQWLKQNSKIYIMLIEESEYRNLDYSIEKKSKKIFKGNIEGKYTLSNTFKYLFG